MDHDKNKSLDIIILNRPNHTRAILRAGLNLIPVVGGSLSSLMDDYIPTVKEKKLNEFLVSLSNKIQLIDESKINKDYIQSEEYAFIFEKCFKSAAENYQKEKLDSFASILLNSLLYQAPSQTEVEIYLGFVNSLMASQIRMLSILNDLKSFVVSMDINETKIRFASYAEWRPLLFPEFSDEIFFVLYEQLRQMGLTRHGKDIPNLLTGEYLFDPKHTLTDLGKRFINFIITNDKNDNSPN